MTLELFSVPMDTELGVGSDLTLRFRYEADNNTKVTLAWTKDGNKLDPNTDDRISVTSEDRPNGTVECDLVIVEVVGSDAGNYQLTLNDKIKSDEITVTVSDVSDMSQKMYGKSVPQNIPKRKGGGEAKNETSTRVAKCAPGKTATIMLALEAEPTPSIIWYKGKIEINLADTKRYGSDSIKNKKRKPKYEIVDKDDPDDESLRRYGLRIRKIDKDDEAIYTCVAQNALGMSKNVVTLMVE